MAKGSSSKTRKSTVALSVYAATVTTIAVAMAIFGGLLYHQLMTTCDFEVQCTLNWIPTNLLYVMLFATNSQIQNSVSTRNYFVFLFQKKTDPALMVVSVFFYSAVLCIFLLTPLLYSALVVVLKCTGPKSGQ